MQCKDRCVLFLKEGRGGGGRERKREVWGRQSELWFSVEEKVER